MDLSLHFDNFELTDPPVADAPLWRYMDLWKLLDVVSTSSLYYCRVDLFPDIFEGTITQRDRDRYVSWFGAHLPTGAQEHYGGPEGYTRAVLADLARMRTLSFACCWNQLDHESMALWPLYARHGIAIRTTTERLVGALTRPDAGYHYLSMVRYVDHDRDVVGTGNNLLPLFAKRAEYSFEHEARLLINLQGSQAPVEPPQGIALSWNLAEAIQEIVVSPFLPGASLEGIRRACASLGLEAPVRMSDYASRPIS